MKQVFAYTAPNPPTGTTPFVQVFDLEDGTHELRVRGVDGAEAKIVLPDTKRLALGMMLTGDFLIVSGADYEGLKLDPSLVV